MNHCADCFHFLRISEGEGECHGSTPQPVLHALSDASRRVSWPLVYADSGCRGWQAQSVGNVDKAVEQLSRYAQEVVRLRELVDSLIQRTEAKPAPVTDDDLAGKMEPCCECGENYPLADLILRGEIDCPKCRKSDPVAKPDPASLCQIIESDDSEYDLDHDMGYMETGEAGA